MYSPSFTASALACLLALVASGCASTPRTTPVNTTASTDARSECARLLSEIAQSEQDKKAAAEKKDNAWHAVVPFIVAARYVDAKTSLGEADERIGKLQNEFNERGCHQQRS
jgi:hypothetical protein